MATIINSIISPNYGAYGRNQTLIKTESEAIPMSSMTTWVTSTSTTTMLAATSKFTVNSLDIVNYDYIVEITNWTKFYYNSGTADAKAQPLMYANMQFVGYTRSYLASSCLTATSKTYNRTTVMYNGTSANSSILVYRTSATAYATYASNAYGIYMSGNTHSLSSTSSDTPNLTVNRPQLNGRCSTTYFTTAFAAAVDKANTKWNITYNVYRVDKGSLIDYMANTTIMNLIRNNY